ncbi:acyltransferase family protein [Alteromonas gracilis]|uniref:SGNH domain-containing protein n=1 Tax=Alteromonas gracilis TaxID=1479524 RepID=A0ABX5CLY5_9ALTE|nr:acyltransferase family protein [Alteromonas gracilis]PRO68455.1 hypothetical protein C6Y39_12470 [Alteromonas gracilis]
MVLLFSDQRNFTGKVLSTGFLTKVGLISYSLYLWHQPILALMKKEYSLHLEPVQILIAITLTFLLSYLTWKYIETPFRNRKRFNGRKILRYSFISVFICFLCGFLLRENLQIQKIVAPEQMARYEILKNADNSHTNQVMFDNKDCKFWSSEFNSNFINRFEKCANKYNGAVFILGGSHGMDLYNAIAKNALNPFVVSVSRGFCRAHEFIGDQSKLPKCQYEDFKTFAKKFSKSISYVLYTQTPDRLFKVNTLHSATHEDLSLERVREVVNYLADIKEKHSLNVIMIGMLPSLKISPISWRYEQPFEQQFDEIISQNSIELTIVVDEIFSTELEKYKIPYISKFESFALTLPNDLILEGGVTYSDNRHISHTGEMIFGQRFIENMVDKGFVLLNSSQ